MMLRLGKAPGEGVQPDGALALVVHILLFVGRRAGHDAGVEQADQVQRLRRLVDRVEASCHHMAAEGG